MEIVGFLKCKYFWVFKRILYKRYYWRFGKVYLNKTSDWTTLRLSAKVSCGSPKNNKCCQLWNVPLI
uniref:Uncharacterized protein n=1 Tax=Meloidogyne enterolobii TaxID=390850 RepID=A0A6V7W5K9_MELEN|nr:unnamed protein product [Meloidogyne enterolobii]